MMVVSSHQRRRRAEAVGRVKDPVRCCRLMRFRVGVSGAERWKMAALMSSGRVPLGSWPVQWVSRSCHVRCAVGHSQKRWSVVSGMLEHRGHWGKLGW